MIMSSFRAYFRLALFAVFIALLILLNSGLQLNDEVSVKRNILKIFPQGWILFMNPELKDTYALYEANAGKWSKVTLKNAEAGNLFGISRKARKIDYERQWFNHHIADSLWTAHADPEQVPPGVREITVKKHPFFTFLKEGRYLLVKINHRLPVSGKLLNKSCQSVIIQCE